MTKPLTGILVQTPGDELHIFWVQERAIGKGTYFPDIGIKNGLNFHNFGKRNGTDFQDFGMKYKVGYTFSKNRYKVGYPFLKPRWHVPDQNLVNCTPRGSNGNGKDYSVSQKLCNVCLAPVEESQIQLSRFLHS